MSTLEQCPLPKTQFHFGNLNKHPQDFQIYYHHYFQGIHQIFAGMLFSIVTMLLLPCLVLPKGKRWHTRNLKLRGKLQLRPHQLDTKSRTNLHGFSTPADLE